MFHKLRDIIRSEGMLGLAHRSVAYAYRRGLRPYMPSEPVRYAGIPIGRDSHRKWGDRLVPKAWLPGANVAKDEPSYEAALVLGLRETVRRGDSVVIVGAGLGVTAIIAALRAGPSGSVQCFEASKHYVRLAQKTAARNRVTNISVHHAVVGELIATFGSSGRNNATDLGPQLSASQLPPCDVLQMDCEGAELGLLREMTIRPRVILVETHGVFGAPTKLVASLLEQRGYAVADRGVAEPRIAKHCTKHDIRVLLGTPRRA